MRNITRVLALLAMMIGLVIAVGGAGAEPFDLNALYQNAQPGDTITIGAGDYSEYQALVRDPDKPAGSEPVHFVFEDGAKFGMIDLGNDTSTLDGITLDGLDVRYLRMIGAHRVTVTDMTAESWDMFGAQDVKISGGSIGPCMADATKACVPRISGSRRVEVDRHLFQGIGSTDLVRFHVDGLAIFGSQDVTIKRSRFQDNWITNIRVQNCCGNPALSNIVIEHNWFGVPTDGRGGKNGNGIDIDSPIPGLLIAYNSFDQWVSEFGPRAGGPSITGDQTGTGARMVGNLFGNAGCAGGVSYEGNFYIPFSPYTGQQACGPDETKVTSFGYLDAAALDFHLTPESPAYAQRDLYEQAAPQASEPTPDPDPTPDPEPAYEPACAPTCDEQIAQLEGDVDGLEQDVTERDTTITGLRDKLSQINVLSAP